MEKQADLMHPPGYLAISGGVIDLRLSFSPCHIQSAVPAENKSEALSRPGPAEWWRGWSLCFGQRINSHVAAVYIWCPQAHCPVPRRLCPERLIQLLRVSDVGQLSSNIHNRKLWPAISRCQRYKLCFQAKGLSSDNPDELKQLNHGWYSAKLSHFE